MSKALHNKNCFFGRPFPIYMFARYYDLDTPIVGGNWNPKDYISEDNWNWIIDCLEVVPNRQYFATMGRSLGSNEFNVNIEELKEDLKTILAKSSSTLEEESDERYYSTGGDCFLVAKQGSDNDYFFWVIVALPEIFEQLDLIPDPCLDYLRVQNCYKMSLCRKRV